MCVLFTLKPGVLMASLNLISYNINTPLTRESWHTLTDFIMSSLLVVVLIMKRNWNVLKTSYCRIRISGWWMIFLSRILFSISFSCVVITGKKNCNRTLLLWYILPWNSTQRRQLRTCRGVRHHASSYTLHVWRHCCAHARVCLYARNVQDLKTTDLGMGNVRLKAEVDFDGRQIGSDTLKSYHNVDEMFEVRHLT